MVLRSNDVPVLSVGRFASGHHAWSQRTKERRDQLHTTDGMPCAWGIADWPSVGGLVCGSSEMSI